MTCPEAEGHLADHLLGETLSDEGGLREHLQQCRDCGADARRMGATIDLLRRLSATERLSPTRKDAIDAAAREPRVRGKWSWPMVAAALMVVAAAVTWVSWPPPAPRRSVATTAAAAQARLTSFEGSVKVKRLGQVVWVPAEVSMGLRKGDRLRTDAGSGANIRFLDGTNVQVRPESLLAIEETFEDPTTGETGVGATLPGGGASFDVPPRRVPGSETQVLTPHVRMTFFEQARGDIETGPEGDRIRIYEARRAAAVQTNAGDRFQLGTQSAVTVDAAGHSGPSRTLPRVPSLLAPASEAEIGYPNPAEATTVLLWRLVPGAVSYHLQIDSSAGFYHPREDRHGLSENTSELRGLPIGSYCWRVAAVDEQRQEGGFSEPARFSITRSQGGRASQPPLVIDSLGLRGNILEIKGHTEPGATVSVDGQALEVQRDGSFGEFISLGKAGAPDVLVRAVGVGGGVTEERRHAVIAE